MKPEEIIKLTKEAREAQKKYFSTRHHEWLYKAQDLERRLDRALAEYEGGQGKLEFDK